MCPSSQTGSRGWIFRAVVLSGLLIGGAVPVLGSTAPIVDSKIETYPVSGDSIAEIQRSIARNTPSRSGNSYYAGVTTWSLSATYTLTPTQQGCLIDNGDVFLKLRVHLPKLTNDLIVEGVRQEWRRFIFSLGAHERQHTQNAYLAATSLLAKLNGKHIEVPCSRARIIAESATKALIERISAYDKDFDHQPRHGATQGGLFKPERALSLADGLDGSRRDLSQLSQGRKLSVAFPS